MRAGPPLHVRRRRLQLGLVIDALVAEYFAVLHTWNKRINHSNREELISSMREPSSVRHQDGKPAPRGGQAGRSPRGQSASFFLLAKRELIDRSAGPIRTKRVRTLRRIEINGSVVSIQSSILEFLMKYFRVRKSCCAIVYR